MFVIFLIEYYKICLKANQNNFHEKIKSTNGDIFSTNGGIVSMREFVIKK